MAHRSPGTRPSARLGLGSGTARSHGYSPADARRPGGQRRVGGHVSLSMAGKAAELVTLLVLATVVLRGLGPIRLRPVRPPADRRHRGHAGSDPGRSHDRRPLRPRRPAGAAGRSRAAWAVSSLTRTHLAVLGVAMWLVLRDPSSFPPLLTGLAFVAGGQRRRHPCAAGRPRPGPDRRVERALRRAQRSPDPRGARAVRPRWRVGCRGRLVLAALAAGRRPSRAPAHHRCANQRHRPTRRRSPLRCAAAAGAALVQLAQRWPSPSPFSLPTRRRPATWRWRPASPSA